MQARSIRKYTARQPLRRALGALVLVPACLALGACSSDELSLGTGEGPLEVGEPSSCGYDESGFVVGDITARNQEQIDALAGCEEVLGHLSILAPGTFNLRALASLRVVRDALTIGADSDSRDSPVGSGPSSLEGLEALEEVGSLTLWNLQSEDILPLSHLTKVQGSRVDRADFVSAIRARGGHILIQGSPNLVNLTGLEGLQEWTDIFLGGNAALSSLDGLGIPSPLLESVRIFDAPALRDLSALAPVEVLVQLELVQTGLESLDVLNLTMVRNELIVRGNPNLVDLDGLVYLQWVWSWTIAGNPKLDHMPDPPSLMTINSLRVMGNDELRIIPAYTFGEGPRDSLGLAEENPDSRTVPGDDFKIVEVAQNPKLAQFILPPRFKDGRYVGIYGNAGLTELDLSTLTNVDRLSIRDNPVLSSVKIEDLETVGDLAVENNLSLSIAGLAEVKTFNRTFDGNVDTPAETSTP